MPDTLRDRIDACTRMLEARCRELDIPTSGDMRVTELDAAKLLGVEPLTVENWRRKNGGGPTWFRIGGITYRLDALAAWIETRRCDSLP